jgi:hypothetical protein
MNTCGSPHDCDEHCGSPHDRDESWRTRFGARAAYRTDAAMRGPIFALFASTRTLDARAPVYERLVWRAGHLPNRRGAARPNVCSVCFDADSRRSRAGLRALGLARGPLTEQTRHHEAQCLPVLLRRGPSTLARRFTSAWFGARAACRTGAVRRGPMFARFASARTLDARAPVYERLVWRAGRLPNRHGTTKPDVCEVRICDVWTTRRRGRDPRPVPGARRAGVRRRRRYRER